MIRSILSAIDCSHEGTSCDSTWRRTSKHARDPANTIETLTPLSSIGTGVTERTTSRCPHCGHGRRKLGRCEVAMFLTDDTGVFRFARAISRLFRIRVNKNFVRRKNVRSARFACAATSSPSCSCTSLHRKVTVALINPLPRAGSRPDRPSDRKGGQKRAVAQRLRQIVSRRPQERRESQDHSGCERHDPREGHRAPVHEHRRRRRPRKPALPACMRLCSPVSTTS